MNPTPAIVAGVVSSAIGWWYLTRPGRSFATAAADLGALVSGSISLSVAQRNMAALISAEFGTHGLGWLATAAIANAYAESRLDPLASGDNGHAIGLFQLNDAVPSAAGFGMTVAARQDPVQNTRRIIEVVQSTDGLHIREARGSATHAELASLFGQWAERCAACGWNAGSAELANRSSLVTSLFGSQVATQVPT